MSNLNSIFLDFGMQLLKNDTVKQHEIITVVLGEMLNNNQVELSENNLILLFYEFFKMCLLSNLNIIFLDFDMQLLKNDTVKQHEIITVVLGEMLNNNQVELSENNLILLFYEFLNVSIEQFKCIFLDFGCNY